MDSRARLGLSLVPLFAALLTPACKTVDKDEADAATIPIPVATVATADPLPAATTPVPVAPTPTATTPTTTPTPKADAGTPLDAGTVTLDAGHPTDAGTAANGTVKACGEKCQALLQSCALPQIPKDGGLPVFKDPAICQAAASACIAACRP